MASVAYTLQHLTHIKIPSLHAFLYMKGPELDIPRIGCQFLDLLLKELAVNDWNRMVLAFIQPNIMIGRMQRQSCKDFCPHLFRAALRALSLRCFAVIFAALALPPFTPPSFPRATAAGSLPSCSGV